MKKILILQIFDLLHSGQDGAFAANDRSAAKRGNRESDVKIASASVLTVKTGVQNRRVAPHTYTLLARCTRAVRSGFCSTIAIVAQPFWRTIRVGIGAAGACRRGWRTPEPVDARTIIIHRALQLNLADVDGRSPGKIPTCTFLLVSLTATRRRATPLSGESRCDHQY
jgi:hypothetical protein